MTAPPPATRKEPPPYPGWYPRLVKGFNSAENAILILAIALMIAIPVTERLLRQFTSFGILGASEFVQHLTLVLAMIGGAVAARENRLLAITTLAQFAPARWSAGIKVFSHSIAAAVAVGLAISGLELVVVEREAGSAVNLIAYGVKKWMFQFFVPLGFALIALRLVRRADERLALRLVTLGGASALIALIWWAPISPQQLWFPLLALLLAAVLLGAPIFTALGGAALILFWSGDFPLASVALNQYTLATEHMIPTIPLFTLAGFVLSEGKAAQRLVAVFQNLVGSFRAGPPLIAVMVCAFFTSFTGGSGVTILALAPLLLPLFLASRCSEKNSLGFMAGAGSLGILFPPSLPVILYFIVASTSGQSDLRLGSLFLGGLIPGLLMLGLLAFWGASRIPAAPKKSQDPAEDNDLDHRSRAAKLLSSARTAIWELMLPVVALTAMFSGIFSTYVAAAATTAIYAIFVEFIVHRELNFFRDFPRILVKCGLLIGGILLILGVANALTQYLIFDQFPDRAVEWITQNIDSKWVFLLMLNLFLILAGCLMDIYSAIVVIVPLLIPLGVAFGIDPVHLAIVFLVNLELGYLTPPIGMNLYLAAYRFDKPVLAIARAALPVLAVFLLGLLLVTYLPILTTFLPKLLE